MTVALTELGPDFRFKTVLTTNGRDLIVIGDGDKALVVPARVVSHNVGPHFEKDRRGMGLSFLSLHTIGLEAQNDLIRILPVEGTPIVRTWNLVHLPGKVLPPSAEALRYFILENVEPELAKMSHDVRPGVERFRP